MTQDDDINGDSAGALDLLRDAIESLSEGFALYDNDHRLVMFNSCYREMNGLVADLLEPGLDYEMMLREMARRGGYADAVGREDEWVAERVENAMEYAQEIEITHTNGQSYIVSIHPTKLGGFVVTRTDVTKRKQAEARARDGDLLVRRVLDASPAAVVMADVGSGDIIYRSPAAVELFGKVKNAMEVFLSPGERADYITALLGDGQVDEYKFNLINAQGEKFPAVAYGRLADYKGEEVAVTTTIDLTEQLALQEELESQRELLFQNEKMSALGELLAGVSHELNNPLSIVVGHSLMMREEAQDPDTIRRIEKISNAAERCAKIVKTFLAMARQQPTRMEKIDISTVITTAVDVAAYGKQREGTAVSAQLDDALPEVLADADQITQVIINLIINADHAINDAGTGDRIDVTASAIKSGRSVEISVSDNGPGVPDRMRPRIFEPFFTTKEVGDGTGIGLALCHRIVHSHGGQIWLDDDHRPGARFCIRLPIGASEKGSTAQDRAVAVEPGPNRVLIVDDEEDVAELIAEILNKDGFSVQTAASGAEALKHLKSISYDIVLSDVNMPEMNGAALFQVLSTDYPDLVERIGFITGDTMGAASQKMLRDSGRPFMEKPVTPSELRRLVQELLDQAEGAD
jgi:signal transduction histidine kinase/CheY-like chemotaxis protein